jgi:hypothetical protein
MQAQNRTWIGGSHDFRLPLGGLRAVQAVCKVGPHEVFNRIAGNVWLVDDLFEVIRQGLIGGGMSTGEASELVTTLFNQHPLLEFREIAKVVLLSALVGDDEEDGTGKKKKGPAKKAPKSGSSRKSTETAP